MIDNVRVANLFKSVKNGTCYVISEEDCTYEELFCINKKGEVLIENIFDNYILISDYFVNKLKNDPKAVVLFIKRNKLLQLSYNVPYFAEHVLFSKFRGEYLIQYIYDLGYLNLIGLSKIKYSKDIFDFISKNEVYYMFGYLSTKLFNRLFEKDENNVYFIERFFDNKKFIDSLLIHYKYPSVLLDILLLRKRYDVLSKLPLEYLFYNCKIGGTYFEYLLKAYKRRKYDFVLDPSLWGCLDFDVAVKFIATLCHYDMLNLYGELSDELLLSIGEYKGKNLSLLEHLLSINPEFVNLIFPLDISNIHILAILDNLNIPHNSMYNIPIDDSLEIDITYNDAFSLSMGPLSKEGEDLLVELKNAFYNDGLSDKEIIDLLVESYRHCLITNYKDTFSEILCILKYKNLYPDKFVYLKSETQTCVDLNTCNIYISILNSFSLLHETAHALHLFSCNVSVPDDFDDILYELNSNVEHLDKVAQFCKNKDLPSAEEKSLLIKFVDKKVNEYFDNMDLSSVNLYLNKLKEETSIKLISLGYSKEFASKTVNCYINLENYKLVVKTRYVNILFNEMVNKNKAEYVRLVSILDDLHSGKLFSGVLVDSNGELIQAISGHKINYFVNNSAIFSEVLADFCVLNKFSGINLIDRLKDLIGENTYDYLEKFYYNEVLQDKELYSKKSM